MPLELVAVRLNQKVALYWIQNTPDTIDVFCVFQATCTVEQFDLSAHPELLMFCEQLASHVHVYHACWDSGLGVLVICGRGDVGNKADTVLLPLLDT